MSIEVHVRVRPGVLNSAWTAADTVLCSTARRDHRFPFSRVYNTSSTNSTIFTAVDPLIHAAFEGKNVTIMAYGQTGSGKTHSMVGTSADCGVMRRTAEILANLRRSYPGTTIEASCIEIYNETVSDLLLEPKERKPIDIRGDGVQTTYDKTTLPITSLQDFVTLHSSAERYRRYGVTDLNSHSSRSHIMLSFHIVRPGREPSVINLVDLAGSESAGKANTTGEALREGGFINKSLLALGNVVSDIVSKKSHISFRGSSLTRLLSPCLSGDGYTFILCCINPGAENYDQTVNALQFSQRAMRIKKDPTVTLTNMPPLFAFPIHRQLQQRQAKHSAAHSAAYESGLYDTYTNLQSGVLTAIFDQQNKAITDAQATAYALQAQLIAKDHLSSLGHLKRQREVAEGHRQRKLAAIASLEERDRTDKDMARRVEEMRNKRHRAEVDHKALLEDSNEAKDQWRAAYEEACAIEFEKTIAALEAQEQRARAEIEAQRPLFLEQFAEKMMATTFPQREEVMRTLGGIMVNPSASLSGGDNCLTSPNGAASSAAARAAINEQKLALYKQQLQQQWTDLNGAAKAVRDLESDLALEINPTLYGLSEAEASAKLHQLEAELKNQLREIQQQTRATTTSTPPPTSRHAVSMSPTPSTAASMSRLKNAVSNIAEAKNKMRHGEVFISSPPEGSSYGTRGTANSAKLLAMGASPNICRPTQSSMAKLSGQHHLSTKVHEDPTSMGGKDRSTSLTSDVVGITARRKAEGVIRGRSRY